MKNPFIFNRIVLTQFPWTKITGYGIYEIFKEMLVILIRPSDKMCSKIMCKIGTYKSIRILLIIVLVDIVGNLLTKSMK